MEIVDGITYLFVEDVALELGVCTSRVRQILLSGDMVGERVGSRYRGYWRILPESVEKYKLVRRKPGKPRK